MCIKYCGGREYCGRDSGGSSELISTQERPLISFRAPVVSLDVLADGLDRVVYSASDPDPEGFSYNFADFVSSYDTGRVAA